MFPRIRDGFVDGRTYSFRPGVAPIVTAPRIEMRHPRRIGCCSVRTVLIFLFGFTGRWKGHEFVHVLSMVRKKMQAQERDDCK